MTAGHSAQELQDSGVREIASQSATGVTDGVEHGLLRSVEVDSTIRLIANVFSANEPPAVAMGLTAQDLAQFLRLVVPQAVEAGLTTVARLCSTGEVVGAMLTGDFAAPLKVDLEAIHRGFRPIFAMLEELDRQYLDGRPAQQGESAHLLMLAVDPRFAGRGMGQRLVKNCLENAGARRYQRAVTEATGVVSQHLFLKLGFAERLRVSYQDYRYAGEAVFSSITGHSGAALMDTSIS